ncbi:MAG: segregation/condensation protein A [Eubacteriales bacterium]|nr:segregation/condensation protein A [Eubacteriales bacterium]
MKEALTYKLEKLDFDGPLDLLLNLIEKNKFDIFDIPIAEITRQYLEYVKKLEERDLDIISDFLLMASTLLDIKTRMLLPREVDEEGKEIDPREELVERLLQYKRFKFLAGELSDEEIEAGKFLYKEETLPAEVKEYKAPLDLTELLEGVDANLLKNIFEEVMRRKTYRVDTERAQFGVIKKERVSLGKRIRHLVRFARNKRNFSFKEMLEGAETRTDVVVTFLAVLELMKMGKLTAVQTSNGSDIDISVTENIDVDELNLEDIVDE